MSVSESDGQNSTRSESTQQPKRGPLVTVDTHLETRLLHDPIRCMIATKVQAAIIELFPEHAPPTLLDLYSSLVEPPKPDLGDLSFGCFALAKTMRVAPPKIAATLAEKMNLQAALPAPASSVPAFGESCLEMATPAGPYLNFKISFGTLSREVLELARTGAMFQVQLTKNMPRTMIEYSQPNTHKELHVGHMRNLCMGLAVVNLLKYAGTELVTCTFPGDVGTHVAKCLWFMKFHNQDPVPETGRGEWLGSMYTLGHLKLEDETGTEKEATNRAQLTSILKQLESKQGEFYDLWRETRQWSIELMEKVYSWAQVKFDRWYWESDVDSSSVRLAQRYLEEGKLIRSEGAVGMDLTEDGLGFMMLLKSDGNGLYATKDLELARRKFEDEHIQQSIYVVDMRQALHFKQVFKALQKLGFEEAKSCFHLQYNFVELPDGPMSSRKGNIIPLMNLISQMQDHVKTSYLARYAEEWTEAEKDLVADQVAQGAIKYGMNRMDNNKKIVFDMTEWLKLDGESGPFIQYSHARIASLLRKLKYDPMAPIAWQGLTQKSERRLAQLIMHFNTIMVTAAVNYKPALVCSYLYDFAKAFNVFYHECPIANAPTAELSQARLGLAAACGAVLANGLGLLGIPAPERM